MSSDFADKVKAINAAYSNQRRDAAQFNQNWKRISAEVVRPVFKTAKDNISGSHVSLGIKEEDDGISLVLMPIPIAKSSIKRLSYHPNTHSEAIVQTTDLGNGENTLSLPLASISTELIESHVEDFLKKALRIKAVQP